MDVTDKYANQEPETQHLLLLYNTKKNCANKRSSEYMHN